MTGKNDGKTGYLFECPGSGPEYSMLCEKCKRPMLEFELTKEDVDALRRVPLIDSYLKKITGCDYLFELGASKEGLVYFKPHISHSTSCLPTTGVTI